MLPEHVSPCHLQRHLLLLDKSIRPFPVIPPAPDPFSLQAHPNAYPRHFVGKHHLVCTLPVEGIYCSALFLWKPFLTSSSEYFLHKPKDLLQKRPSASEHYCSHIPTGPTASGNLSQACVTLGQGCTAHWQLTSHESASLPKSYPLTLGMPP